MSIILDISSVKTPWNPNGCTSLRKSTRQSCLQSSDFQCCFSGLFETDNKSSPKSLTIGRFMAKISQRWGTRRINSLMILIHLWANVHSTHQLLVPKVIFQFHISNKITWHLTRISDLLDLSSRLKITKEIHKISTSIAKYSTINLIYLIYDHKN